MGKSDKKAELAEGLERTKATLQAAGKVSYTISAESIAELRGAAEMIIQTCDQVALMDDVPAKKINARILDTAALPVDLFLRHSVLAALRAEAIADYKKTGSVHPGIELTDEKGTILDGETDEISSSDNSVRESTDERPANEGRKKGRQEAGGDRPADTGSERGEGR
jgi:hypothetical protein